MIRTKDNALAFTGLLALVFATSCDNTNSPPPPPMVTIAGIVRNVDTGQPAPGVRVRLYDTNYMDEVATGSDGAYRLKVPQGSTLWLFADDFDNATADIWFPLINVDHPNLTADRDLLDWPIHCCPHSGGSVDAWNHYLQDVDPVAGDRFVPSSAAGSGGIVTISIWDVVNGAWDTPVAGFRIETNTPMFPVGHTIGDSILAGRGFYFHPPSRTTTDDVGWVLSFGDPAYTGRTVTVTIADTDTMRAYAFASPWEIPVAPGTITLGQFIGAVDGVPNRSARDILCAAQFFTCAP